MATHESFEHKAIAEPPSERSFAWVFTVFFLLLALWPLWRGKPMRWWWLPAAGLMALIGLIRPALLRVPNRLWFQLGTLLGRITTPIVMALLFYVVFTPIAILLRMTGRDLLRLRRDPAAKTYWIPRDPPGPEPSSMVEQF